MKSFFPKKIAHTHRAEREKLKTLIVPTSLFIIENSQMYGQRLLSSLILLLNKRDNEKKKLKFFIWFST